MQGLKIVSTGRCLPETIVTNDDMAKIVDTNDEWITSRTGIKTRHFCKSESVTDLAAGAARAALDKAGIRADDLAACVVCTVTPECSAPSMGCLVQGALGLPENIPCFDINVGCTGFVYGLQIVRGMLLQSEKRHALLLGAEALSRITDFTDRSTCVLFGDGAGAVVLALEEGRPYGCVLGARCSKEAILIEGPGGKKPTIHMDGQAVFRFAVEAVPKCIDQLLNQTGLSLSDVDWFVPHQANQRIVDFAARRLGVAPEKFYQNMVRYGNTSAASIPIALDEMSEQGLLRPGQKIVCVGFGAGLTWGGALLEW